MTVALALRSEAAPCASSLGSTRAWTRLGSAPASGPPIDRADAPALDVLSGMIGRRAVAASQEVRSGRGAGTLAAEAVVRVSGGDRQAIREGLRA
jgi:hypothetical protein